MVNAAWRAGANGAPMRPPASGSSVLWLCGAVVLMGGCNKAALPESLVLSRLFARRRTKRICASVSWARVRPSCAYAHALCHPLFRSVLAKVKAGSEKFGNVAEVVAHGKEEEAALMQARRSRRFSAQNWPSHHVPSQIVGKFKPSPVDLSALLAWRHSSEF